MPFNIWCGGCNSMIAKGVRFNAEKKQVGNYYSTKVKFTDPMSSRHFSDIYVTKTKIYWNYDIKSIFPQSISIFPSQTYYKSEYLFFFHGDHSKLRYLYTPSIKL